MARPVFIIDGSRTPFLKARSGPGPFTPVDLAVQCGRPLLARQPFAPDAFDQVILGCVNVIADEMNPARVAALRLGMGEAMVAFTVQINCGSGMQSIDTGYRYIREGISDLILAGGAEALSYAPLVWPQQGVRWFAGLAGAKGILRQARGARQGAAGLLQADHRPRARADRSRSPNSTWARPPKWSAISSASRASSRTPMPSKATSGWRNAQAQGFLKGEVETAFARDGKFYDHDDGVRPDSTPEKLATAQAGVRAALGPGHRRQFLADHRRRVLDHPRLGRSGDKARPDAEGRDRRQPMVGARSLDHGPRPGAVGDRTVEAQQTVACSDIETWELNEAFATQVLGCLAAWNDEKFCREILGLDGAAGRDRPRQAQCRWRRHQPRPSRRLQRQPHRAASRQRDEAARHQARHRHRMHRRRAGRRHADRDGVTSWIAGSWTFSPIACSNSGRSPTTTGPYRNFKLTRDADGIAWLLFDRDGASANTLSADVIEELDTVLAALESRAPDRARHPLGEAIRLHRRRRRQRISRRDRSARRRDRDRPGACGDRPPRRR